MSAYHRKKLIAICAWKIMADPSTSDESYSVAAVIYRLTADESLRQDRPIRIKVTEIQKP